MEICRSEKPQYSHVARAETRVTSAGCVVHIRAQKVGAGRIDPRIEHDLDLGIVRRQNRIGVRCRPRLAIPVYGNIVVGD